MGGGAGAAGVDDLESLVGRWVAVRTEAAAESRAWSDQERSLRREIDLLETERSALEAEANAFSEAASSGEERRAKDAAHSARQQAVIDALRAPLDRMEAGLRPWAVRIPKSLGDEASRLIRELPEPAAARRQSPGERMQRVVTLLSILESLQHRIHVTQEALPDDAGRTRLADVLYIGLARGFAVSPDDTWAAVGTPGRDGWTWQVRSEMAASVRRAIRMARRDSTADFVDLPLRAASRELAP
jgi:hypothetical protein